MTEWVGQLATLRDRRWRKPVLVRIIDAEQAPGVCNCYPSCGRPDDIHVWFWAKYA